MHVQEEVDPELYSRFKTKRWTGALAIAPERVKEYIRHNLERSMETDRYVARTSDLAGDITCLARCKYSLHWIDCTLDTLLSLEVRSAP